MPRPVHFELGADNAERAIKFYESVFGWQFEKWAGPMEYWLITTGQEGEPGIDGGLGLRSDNTMSVNTVGVTDVDAAVAAVEANGGSVLVPKQTIPGVGYLAYCQDTEGNTFGVMASDETTQ